MSWMLSVAVCCEAVVCSRCVCANHDGVSVLQCRLTPLLLSGRAVERAAATKGRGGTRERARTRWHRHPVRGIVIVKHDSDLQSRNLRRSSIIYTLPVLTADQHSQMHVSKIVYGSPMWHCKDICLSFKRFFQLQNKTNPDSKRHYYALHKDNLWRNKQSLQMNEREYFKTE